LGGYRIDLAITNKCINFLSFFIFLYLVHYKSPFWFHVWGIFHRGLEEGRRGTVLVRELRWKEEVTREDGWMDQG
jgi:hypothetical protein